jgi:hypothetical protein
MVWKTALGTVVVLLLASAAGANGTCDVPEQMTREQKVPCVRAATVLLDQPTLSLEQLTNGPGFDSSDPAGSRFMYFTRADTLNCYFRPHFAFIRDKGMSPKFLCWQLAGPSAFFDHMGHPIDVDDVKVVVAKSKSGELRSSLFAKSDTANAHEIKADQVKVNYLLPPYPNHDRRDNEVFTQVAATRILWALGFPADYQYSAQAANCVGCTTDPFKENLKENKASLHDRPVGFRVVAIERLMPGDAIEANHDDTWSWADANRFYDNGWTREQKEAFDAYRLALGLLTYHNPLDSQNRLMCAAWKDGADDARVCTRPFIMVQDVGSTFGKPGTFGNSRGDFGGWQSQTVFANADRCELRYPLKGNATVLKDAQDLLLRRLENLDREHVKAIFATSRFDMADQKQLDRLRRSGAANVEDAALNEWTDVFMRHIAEVRAARNCRN